MFFDQISEVINKIQWNMGLAKKKKKKIHGNKIHKNPSVCWLIFED